MPLLQLYFKQDSLTLSDAGVHSFHIIIKCVGGTLEKTVI